MTNETFNKYYKACPRFAALDTYPPRLTLPSAPQAQGIIPESEWDDFINAFRQPLPTTFRLTSSRP